MNSVIAVASSQISAFEERDTQTFCFETPPALQDTERDGGPLPCNSTGGDMKAFLAYVLLTGLPRFQSMVIVPSQVQSSRMSDMMRISIRLHGVPALAHSNGDRGQSSLTPRTLSPSSIRRVVAVPTSVDALDPCPLPSANFPSYRVSVTDPLSRTSLRYLRSDLYKHTINRTTRLRHHKISQICLQKPNISCIHILLPDLYLRYGGY